MLNDSLANHTNWRAVTVSFVVPMPANSVLISNEILIAALHWTVAILGLLSAARSSSMLILAYRSHSVLMTTLSSFVCSFSQFGSVYFPSTLLSLALSVTHSPLDLASVLRSFSMFIFGR